jgi:D-beta-D-heptose 7-phosphate kinase / D-beta-D-heptose 1-phosphate adenosyltransferase
MVGPCPDDATMVLKARSLLAKQHIEALLITRGESGMSFITPHPVQHLPAVTREIYDVTGAGDTVISTLGAALAAGAPATDAVYLANLAAGIAVTKLGTTAVSLHELEEAYSGPMQVGRGVVQEAELLERVQRVRALGKKIVFTNGCYDLIHAGHVKSLEMAKALGDYLIVAVNTDESVQALKGALRPITCLAHRMTLLAGLHAVDWVVPFADSTPRRLLNMIKPDVLVKGGDYRIDQVVGSDIVSAYGGTVHVVQHGETLSTTDIINKIHALRQMHADLVTEDT